MPLTGIMSSIMVTIDQRILIPAPQDGVWAYLSEISNNPSWQTNCRAISFLSSKRQGVGTRWRETNDKGHDTIYEVLSWYNGLGYEYTCIDGCAYHDSRVRIRLQEIAEGTIVQWTYSFEPKGVFSGLRGGSRQLENVIASSLKNLYRQIKIAHKSGQLTPRSLMQESPDVSGRSAYQPRHVPHFDEKKLTPDVLMQPIAEPPILEDDGQEFTAFDFDEPPITESDTRPHPAITETGESSALKAENAAAEIPNLPEPEPDFLKDLPSQPEADLSLDFDLDIPVAGTSETFVDDAIFAPPPELEAPAKPLPSQVMTEALDFPVSEILVEPEVAPISEPTDPVSLQPELALEIEAPDSPEKQDHQPSETALPAILLNEGESRSIWEIFGVTKPSEIEGESPASLAAAEAVVSDAVAAPITKPDVPFITRHGFRARERRKIARIRYPQ